LTNEETWLSISELPVDGFKEELNALGHEGAYDGWPDQLLSVSSLQTKTGQAGQKIAVPAAHII